MLRLLKRQRCWCSEKVKCLLGGRRGQLTSLTDRQHYASLIDEAVSSGAKEKACEEVGMSVRTLQRWQESGEISGDKRPTADRPEPSNMSTRGRAASDISYL